MGEKESAERVFYTVEEIEVCYFPKTARERQREKEMRDPEQFRRAIEREVRRCFEDREGEGN